MIKIIQLFESIATMELAKAALQLVPPPVKKSSHTHVVPKSFSAPKVKAITRTTHK
jgi:hypothetical protein